MAGVNALQRQQDWGTQYLDDSSQWLQNEDAGARAADPSGVDENGARFATGASDPPPASLMSALIATVTGGGAGAAMTPPPAPSAPTGTVVTPDIETAQSVDIAVGAPAAASVAAAPAADAAAPAAPATLAPGDHTADEWAQISAAWQAAPNDFATLYQAMNQHGWTDADIAHVSGLTEQQVGDGLTRAGAQAGFGGAATIGREAIQLAFFTALQAEQSNPPAQADASRPWWIMTPGRMTQQVTYGGSGMQIVYTPIAATFNFDLPAFTTWYASQATPAAQAFASVLGAFTVDAAGALNFAGSATLSASGKGFGWATSALIPAPVATPESKPPASADPASSDATLVDGRTVEEWAQISTTWQAAKGDFFVLYQAMDERGWTAADIAHVSGMTEQQVGDYLTSGGAPAGFGGAVTLGRDAIDNPYLAALANEQANPPSTPDASRPWWSAVTPPPGAELNANGQLVDESGNVLPAMSFNLAVFTNWYESQPTTDAQNFARQHGGMSAGTASSVHFASGASVSLSGAGSASLQWPMDKRITDYASYQRLDVLQRAGLQMMVETAQNEQILQVFGSGIPATLPPTEMADRMRALYGTDLATRMYQLSLATDAMKAHFANDLNAELANRPGQNDASRPWWTVTPVVTSETTVYDGSGMHRVTNTTGGSSQFDLAAYQSWYCSQANVANQLIAEVFGTGMSAGTMQSEGRPNTLDYRLNGPVWNKVAYKTTGQLDSLTIELTSDSSGSIKGARVSTDALGKDLTRVDLANPKDLYEPSQVTYLPMEGFVTSRTNIRDDPSFLEVAVPMFLVAVVGWATAGAASTALTNALGSAAASAVATGALVGAVTTATSGLINDNLSLQNVLRGALSGALTTGLAEGLNVAVPGASLTIAGRMTIQGTVQALMGGSFKDGALAGLASGLAKSMAESMNAGITTAIDTNTMTQAEGAAARVFCNMFGAAVKIVASGSSAPGYAEAQALVDGVMEGMGLPRTTLDPTKIGTMGQDLTPVIVGDPNGSTTPVPTPPPPPPAPTTDPVATSDGTVSSPPPAPTASTDPTLSGTTGQALPPVTETTGGQTTVTPTPPPSPITISGPAPTPPPIDPPPPTPAPTTSNGGQDTSGGGATSYPIDGSSGVPAPSSEVYEMTRQDDSGRLVQHDIWIGDAKVFEYHSDVPGQYTLTMGADQALVRQPNGELAVVSANKADNSLGTVVARPGQTIVGTDTQSLTLKAGAGSDSLALATALTLTAGTAESTAGGSGLLATLGGAAVRALGTLGLTVWPSDLAGGETVVSLTDDARIVKPGSDVTDGWLEVRDASGQWQRVQNHQYNPDEALRLLNSPRTSMLTPDEIANLSGPKIYVPPPSEPPTGTPPLTLPNGGSDVTSTPGSVASPPSGPVITTPADPMNPDDLLIDRSSAEQKRFRQATIADAQKVDPSFDPTGFEAHHIVPLNEYPELIDLRTKLKGWGIDLNSAANGVMLPRSPDDGDTTTAHRDTQKNSAYEAAIEDSFSGVTNADQPRRYFAPLATS